MPAELAHKQKKGKRKAAAQPDVEPPGAGPVAWFPRSAALSLSRVSTHCLCCRAGSSGAGRAAASAEAQEKAERGRGTSAGGACVAGSAVLRHSEGARGFTQCGCACRRWTTPGPRRRRQRMKSPAQPRRTRPPRCRSPVTQGRARPQTAARRPCRRRRAPALHLHLHVHRHE